MADLPLGEASPEPSGRGPTITRRQLLRHSVIGVAGSALGLTVLTGCHHDTARTSAATPKPAATKTPKSSRTPTPSSVTPSSVAHVVAAELALLAAYDAAAVAHPGYAAPLAVLRAHHLQHLHALDPTVPTPSPTPTAASSTPASPAISGSPPVSSATASPVTSPPTAAETMAALATLERDAASARLDDAAKSTGSLARLIACIGGCEATHVVALEGLS